VLDILITLLALYFIGMLFFVMGWLGWTAFKLLDPTNIDSCPRSGATVMSQEDYDRRYDDWVRRQRTENTQRSSLQRSNPSIKRSRMISRRQFITGSW